MVRNLKTKISSLRILVYLGEHLSDLGVDTAQELLLLDTRENFSSLEAEYKTKFKVHQNYFIHNSMVTELKTHDFLCIFVLFNPLKKLNFTT